MNGSDVKLKADEVGVALGEGKESGRIVLALAEPSKWISMDPRQAVAIAKDMIDKAVKLGAQVEIVMPRKEVNGTQRAVLVTRTKLVMKGQLERGVKVEHLAEQLVDIILSGAP